MRFLLEEPASDQAFAVRRLLLSGDRPADVAGVATDPGDALAAARMGGALVHRNDAREGVVVPTGVRSTSAALSRGPITLGRFTLDPVSGKVADKRVLLERAQDLGISVPRTLSLEEYLESPFFPAFFKEREEAGGGRRGLIRTPHDLNELGSGLIVQEYVASLGTYGVAFLADRGVIRHHVGHFESVSMPVTGGSAVQIELWDDPLLFERTRELVAGLGYSGWGLAEFKRAGDGDYTLMEINAKLWASCEFTFRNRPDMFTDLFRVRHGLPPVRRLIFVHRLIRSPKNVLHVKPRRRGQEFVWYPTIIPLLAAKLKTLP